MAHTVHLYDGALQSAAIVVLVAKQFVKTEPERRNWALPALAVAAATYHVDYASSPWFWVRLSLFTALMAGQVFAPATYTHPTFPKVAIHTDIFFVGAAAIVALLATVFWSENTHDAFVFQAPYGTGWHCIVYVAIALAYIIAVYFKDRFK